VGTGGLEVNLPLDIVVLPVRSAVEGDLGVLLEVFFALLR